MRPAEFSPDRSDLADGYDTPQPPGGREPPDAGGGLRERLARLPAGHPSAPDYEPPGPDDEPPRAGAVPAGPAGHRPAAAPGGRDHHGAADGAAPERITGQGEREQRELYRPWFSGDESPQPWFAEPWLTADPGS